MKVLLIQPPIEDFYTTPIRLYPLGLLYAAATLRKLDCEVDLLDCLSPLHKRQLPFPPFCNYLKPHFQNTPYLFKAYYRFGLTDEQIMEKIRHSHPDLIGISSQFTAYFTSVARLATLIKSEFNIPIFIGGNHATALHKEIMQRTDAIDDVLIGPAETALPQFWANRFGGQFAALDWKSLQPAHDLASPQAYRIGRQPYISLIASRGCPFACEFCSVHAMFGRTIDYRPIDDVIEEMRRNLKHKGVRIFNFEDDNLSFNRRWFKTFLQRVIDEPLLKGIELTAMNGLCYPTLNQELLELMWVAGFRRLNLSFVSQDADLRRSLRRPASDGNFSALVASAQKLGFNITAYIIIGLPEQTYDEVRQSINYLLGLGVLVGPSVFYIPPASELYDKLEISEKVRETWELYRSSAFAVETRFIKREQLIELFAYARAENIKRRR
jgi:radical SAM superfamily enzyme YgiQ (UPF0313 family)